MNTKVSIKNLIKLTNIYKKWSRKKQKTEITKEKNDKVITDVKMMIGPYHK